MSHRALFPSQEWTIPSERVTLPPKDWLPAPQRVILPREKQLETGRNMATEGKTILHQTNGTFELLL